jgi:hypothetical protein
MSKQSNKSKRRSSHQTQWAAQFAVASELCKRGYEVAFTMGNHPEVDLMVISPKRRSFHVDVKGLYKKNFWLVSSKPKRTSLFYAFAYVPTGEPNRFFIMTQGQVNREIKRDLKRIKAKGLNIDKHIPFLGVKWGTAELYEKRWQVLPK